MNNINITHFKEQPWLIGWTWSPSELGFNSRRQP